jgi:O-antigen/teichoic acid export membrane protein
MSNEIRRRSTELVKSAERYLQTDVLYLIKGGASLGVAQAVTSISVFLMAMAYARFVPKETYGTYQFILSLMGIVAAFSLTGLGQSMVRAVAKKRWYSSRRILWKGLAWNSTSSLVALVICLYYFAQDNKIIGTALIIAGALVPLLNIFQTYDAPIVGQSRFPVAAGFQIARSIGVALLMLIAILKTDSALLMFLVYLVSHVAITGIFYFYSHKKFDRSSDPLNREKDSEAIDDSEDILAIGKDFSVMNLIGKISGEIDRILLFHFLGPVQVATYSFAIAAPRQVQHINKTLKGLLLSKLSARAPDVLKKTLPRKALWMYAYILPILALYIPLAPFLYKIIFPAYVDAAVYSQVYALVLLFAPLIVLNEALVAHGAQRDLYIINAAVPASRLTLLFFLVPFIGIWGVIIATLGSLCVQTFLVIRFFCRL